MSLGSPPCSTAAEGARGDLGAVVRAILLDEEARGDLKSDPNYGRLRHPAQFIANVLRAFGAASADKTSSSDGYLNPQSVLMGMDVFRPPSVFSYFSPGTVVPGTAGVRGPEFGILSTSTALRRLNFVNTIVFTGIAVSANAPSGTALDFSALQALASDPARLVDALNARLLHGTMSGEMRADHSGSRRRRSRLQLAEACPHGRVSRRDIVAVPGSEVIMPLTRREFLLQAGHACAGYALGAAAFAAGIERFGLINALAQGANYRTSGVRLPRRRQRRQQPGRADEQHGILGIFSGPGCLRAGHSQRPPAADRPASLNSPFGLHPSLSELHALWTQQKLSIVCNAGPLVQPLNRQQYQSGAPRPYQLFSHSDQVAQWQTSIADRIASTGWGGRMADRFRATNSAVPDDHRAVRRSVHSRAEDARRCRSPLPRRRSIKCWS